MRLRATLGMLLTIAALAGQTHPATASERARSGGVVILADAGLHHGIGAGTVVAIDGDRVEIVTAKHVAVYGSLRVRLEDGTSVPAWISSLVPDRDLAIVDADLPDVAIAGLRPARIGTARSDEPVVVWGSGNDGPAFETGATADVFADLPDGAPRGRYSLACALCHQGDSGAGVFAPDGSLVGVYIGFFTVGAKRVSVAELPTAIAPRRVLQESVAFATAPDANADVASPAAFAAR